MSHPTDQPGTGTHCPRCGSTSLSGGLCRACVLGELMDGGRESFPSAPPPRRAGEYDLVEELARGGMGIVWRARQRRLNREVALKFVLDGVLPGETLARRFRQEAEVAAQLSHPHIISVYEVGEADGRYFISMELAAGGSLAERLLNERMPVRSAAELTLKLAHALQHAHGRGVLHRDLKPGNVLFDAAGEPRLSDFGLARLAMGGSVMTMAGAVMGTPSYMAPEQARGDATGVTTAADIYGLGAILYEMLAGHPVFRGEIAVDVLRRVLDEEPARLTGVDADLETICQKCLRKLPAERYESARELADDIERWLHGEPIRARRLSVPQRLWKWARRHPLLAALWVALAGAAGVIAVLIVTSRVQLAEARGAADASARESQHRRADQHTTAAVLAIERGDSLRALPSLAEAIRIGTGDQGRDRVNRIRFGTTLRLAPELEQIWFPSWVNDVQFTRDQNRVIICDNRTVRVENLQSGMKSFPPLLIGGQPMQAAVHAALSRALVQTDGGGVSVWNLEDGVCLSRCRGQMLEPRLLFPQGETACAVWEGNRAQRLSLIEPGLTQPAVEHPSAVEWAWLCPGGMRLLTCAADRLLRLWDLSSGRLLWEPVICREGTSIAVVDLARGLVTVKPGDGDGWVVSLRDGVPPVPFSSRGDVRAAGNADGWTHLAHSTRDGFVVNTAENGEVLVTAMHGSRGNDACFSGNGFRVFTRAIDSSSRLWITAGGRALTPFLWQGTDPLHCALSDGGERILVSSREPEVRLWRLRPEDGALTADVIPAVSGKADWLKYELLKKRRNLSRVFSTTDAAGGIRMHNTAEADFQLHVVDAATGHERFPPLQHQSAVVHAVLSPDRRRIASFTLSQCAYLWDASTGQQIGPLLRHDRVIDFAAFSPDSTLLATAGVRTMRIWEAASGSAAAPPLMHEGSLIRIEWSADSRTVSGSDEKGRRRTWDVSPDTRGAEQLGRIAGLYSAHQVTPGGALAPLGRRAIIAAWEDLQQKLKE